MTHRYAVYFSPSTASPLGAFGAEWLGRTIEGQDLAPPVLSRVSSEDWQSAIAAPRMYGFHATLKPPFRLADGTTEDALLSAVKSFCEATTPVDLGILSIDRIAGFLALTPERKDGIGRLAADIVRAFDTFRAPLTPDEVEKRRPDMLSNIQRNMLESWGYPYVMGEFRFHMTLTGRLSPEDAERFDAELRDRFQPHAQTPVSVDDICIFRQEAPERGLVLSHRFSLRPS